MTLWSNSDEMNAVNSKMLSGFLQSLLLVSLRPRRFVLQTGLKHYGTHLGPSSIPNMESAARIPSPPFPPNFYYAQEDLLFEFCRVHSPTTSWNIIRPSWVLGAVPDAAMNILYPLSIYATVQQAMGDSLDFPGDWDGWDKEQMQSSATLNGYLGRPNCTCCEQRFQCLRRGCMDVGNVLADIGCMVWHSLESSCDGREQIPGS